MPVPIVVPIVQEELIVPVPIIVPIILSPLFVPIILSPLFGSSADGGGFEPSTIALNTTLVLRIASLHLCAGFSEATCPLPNILNVRFSMPPFGNALSKF